MPVVCVDPDTPNDALVVVDLLVAPSMDRTALVDLVHVIPGAMIVTAFCSVNGNMVIALLPSPSNAVMPLKKTVPSDDSLAVIHPPFSDPKAAPYVPYLFCAGCPPLPVVALIVGVFVFAVIALE